MLLGLFIFILCFYPLLALLLSKVIIWSANGFGYDIADKFWYLFWPILIILYFVPRGK
jgi:hypothetical protein